jgi:phosphate-selective porin
MVEMQNKNRDSELRPQLGENPEKGHRIRAARNADANTAARPNHVVAVNGLEDAFVEGFLHRQKPMR